MYSTRPFFTQIGIIWAFFCFIIVATTSAQTTKKSYKTHSIQGTDLLIDGKLNEPVWQETEWSGNFLVWEPDNGAVPKNDTRFKVLYDDSYLYVGLQLFDSAPDSLEKRLTSRDGFDGDRVSLVIDSYYDKQTAFSFTLSTSGVQGDEFVSRNGDNWDESWNAIWYGKTTIDEQAWYAEFKIPLSQIRFGNKEDQVWGFQIFRHDFRNGELSMWQHITLDAPGFINLFGQIKGIKNLKPQRQFEIMPYVVSRTERVPKEIGNPFNNNELEGAYGLDAKIGLTNDMILDLTINPDFGQVEADPSVVNLSNFENFFREQRPFFIEGSAITNFQLARADIGGSFSQDNLFYSRRIGRSPQAGADVAAGEYANAPTATRILSAAKVTGKNKNGLSIGFINSVTREETAEIAGADNIRRKQTVEPLTNYTVARVAREFDNGDRSIGAMFTATNRFTSEEHLDFLHKEAYTGGIDGFHTWNDRSWQLAGNVHFSHIAGSEEALIRTQRSGVHNFQRVGASHIKVDSSLTSMSGMGGTLTLGRYGNGNWSFQTGLNVRTPNLETNDIGFLREADRIYQFTWAGYRTLAPTNRLNSFRVNLNQWNDWDFSGLHVRQGFNVNNHFQFKNFWNFSVGGNYNSQVVTTNGLRGGPAFILPKSGNIWFFLGTDQRKKFFMGVNPFYATSERGLRSGYGIEFDLNYQPSANIRLSMNPGYNYDEDAYQWFDNIKAENGQTNYLMGRIKQHTFSTSFRVNYIISPFMNVQLWAQPFVARGEYDAFNIAANTLSANLDERTKYIKSSFDPNSDQYLVDEDVDGQTDYRFNNPNFNFGQFRSNLVFRWEFRPGSNLFLVWTQDRTGSLNEPMLSESLTRGIPELEGSHVFLMKFSYRFLR